MRATTTTTCQKINWEESKRRHYSSSVKSLDQVHSKPIRVGIVGSGPSGFYTAKYLMQAFPPSSSQDEEVSSRESTHAPPPPHLKLDIMDRLPTPFGLVRNGVAPDHPEVKNVENDFAALMENNKDDVGDSTIDFYGNVELGKDVSLAELRSIYDIVVLAYGCEDDRSLSGITDADATGILSAREFVAWYNGHVDFGYVGAKVEEALLSSTSSVSDHQGGRHVVIIGQGNVALDCARILAKASNGDQRSASSSSLADTDISSEALLLLESTQIERITLLGRRGHVQAAFTIKELRELTKLDEMSLVVRRDEMDMGYNHDASQKELESSRAKTRIHKLLQDVVESSSTEEKHGDVCLRFLMRPVEVETAQDGDNKRLQAILCERTKLDTREGTTNQVVAVGTGEIERLPADLVLVSVGYKARVADPDLEAHWDEASGRTQHTGGRLEAPNATTAVTNGEGRSTTGGLYVVGWLKRGPSGIIGTNIMDAKDTVLTIQEDLKKKFQVGYTEDDDSESMTTLVDLLKGRNVRFVNWEGFGRIDQAEKDPTRFRSPNQPREKITTRSELLNVAFEEV